MKKLMKTRLTAIAGVPALLVMALAGHTAGAAAPPSAGPAPLVMALAGHADHAASPPASALAASSWVLVYVHAEAGNGCMDPGPDQRLSPVVMEPCSSAHEWYVRDLSGNNWLVNDFYELVDTSKTYMFGFSGGLFKMETPSLPAGDIDTLLIDVSYSYWGLTLPPGSQSESPEPRGAGQTLLAVGGIPLPGYPDAWAFCPTNDSTCGTTPKYT